MTYINDLDQLGACTEGAGYLTVIPVRDQVTMLRSTIENLGRFGLKRFLILDNGSTYPPMLKFQKETDIPVFVFATNPGPRYYSEEPIWKLLPEMFFVTDPDLGYPPEIPETVVSDMVGLSEKHKWGKVALALNKDCKELFTENVRNGVDSWEGHAWGEVVDTLPGGDPVWKAYTDTTFHLNNKKYYRDFYTAPRVGGRYTLHHYGWHTVRPGPAEEYAYYDKHKTHWSMTAR